MGNLQLINTFDGVREAERLTGINHSSISGCCTGRLKTAGKFIWSYETLFLIKREERKVIATETIGNKKENDEAFNEPNEEVSEEDKENE